MNTVWFGFVVAAMGVFVGTRMYRLGYNFPVPHRCEASKKALLKALGWLAALAAVVMGWIVVSIPFAPLSGVPMVLVTLTGVIACFSPLAGLLVGIKRGRQRLNQGQAS